MAEKKAQPCVHADGNIQSLHICGRQSRLASAAEIDIPHRLSLSGTAAGTP